MNSKTDRAGPGGCCHLTPRCRNWSKRLGPEISLICCATECLKATWIMRNSDSVCFLEEIMKASRFVPQWSSVLRKGFIGACPLQNHCIDGERGGWRPSMAIEPSDPRRIEAFCKAKGISFTASTSNLLHRHGPSTS